MHVLGVVGARMVRTGLGSRGGAVIQLPLVPWIRVVSEAGALNSEGCSHDHGSLHFAEASCLRSVRTRLG